MASNSNFTARVIMVPDTTKLDTVMKQYATGAASVKSIGTEAKQSNTLLKTLTSNLGDTFAKVMKFGAITATIGLMTTGIHSAVESILEMDKALTEFKKVSDLAGEGLDNFKKKAFEAGQEVAKTGAEMIESATEFRKSGFTDEDSLHLAKISSLYQNIADSQLDAGDAASYIISQMKAFNITSDNAIDIINKTNEVSNKFAVSSTDISSALTKSSSSLATYGNTIDETISLVVAGTEILTGQAGKVGRGLRSAGANIVKMANSTGELVYTVNNATKSISLLDSTTGKMKNTYTVLSEVASQWDKMSAAEQSAVALQLGNKTQLDTVTAVLKNFDSAVQANEVSLNSQGSAMKENARYMESLDSKIQSIKSSFSLWAEKGAGIVGMLLDVANGFMQINNSIEIFTPLLVMAGVKFTGLSNLVIAKTTEMGVALGVSTGGLTWIIGGLVLALSNIPNIIDHFSTSVDEHTDKINELKDSYKTTQDEIDTLNSKKVLSESDEYRLKILEAQLDVLQQQTLEEERARARATTFGEGVWFDSGAMGDLQDATSQLQTSIDDYQEALAGGFSAEYLTEYREIIVETSAKASEAKKTLAENSQYLTDSEKAELENEIAYAEKLLETVDALGLFEKTQSAVNDSMQEAEVDTEAIAEEFKALNDELDSLQELYDEVSGAIEEYNENGYLSIDTYQKLLSLGNEYIGLLFDEQGNLLNTDSAVRALTEARINDLAVEKAYSMIDTAKKLDAEGNAALIAASKWDSATKSLWDFVGASIASSGLSTEAQTGLKAQIDQVQKWSEAAKLGIGKTTSKTSKSTKSSSATDPLKEQSDIFKDQLKILTNQLSILEEINGTEYQRIDKLKEIQEKIKKQEAWYRSKGLSDNSEYISDLMKQWYQYESQIKQIYKEIYQTQIKKQETAADYVVNLTDKIISKLEEQKSAEEKYWDEKIDALNTQNQALQDQISLEEALNNLEQAKSKRVLVYKEGQFQYASDVGAISEAQAQLESLKREQALKAETEALEKQKNESIKIIDEQIEAWEKYKDTWASMVSDIDNEQNRLIALQAFGLSAEQSNWLTRLEGYSEFLQGYAGESGNLANIQQQYQDLFLANQSEGLGTEKQNLIDRIGNYVAFAKEYASIRQKLQQLDEDGVIPTFSSSEVKFVNSNASSGSSGSVSSIVQKGTSSATKKTGGGGGTSALSKYLSRYADGTTSATGGLSMVGEQGAELRVLNRGDGIIPAQLSKNLMTLGQFNPIDIIKGIYRKANEGVVYNTFDKLVLPNVHNAETFIKELNNFKNLTAQRLATQ